jgi:hypothetical protein
MKVVHLNSKRVEEDQQLGRMVAQLTANMRRRANRQIRKMMETKDTRNRTLYAPTKTI